VDFRLKNKTMKKIFLGLFILLFSVSQSQSQERVNKEQLTFKAKSGKIKKAVGWQLDNSGEWVSNRNAISYDNNGSVYEYHCVDNFKWIQAGIINHEGTDYYFIMYEAEDGQWRYENIREGWFNYKKTHVTILTQESFNNLERVIKEKKAVDYTVSSIMRASMRSNLGEQYYNEKYLLTQIGYNFKFGRPLLNEEEDAIVEFMTVNSQTVKGVDMVRFRLNTVLDIEVSYSSDEKVVEPIKDSYFEIDLEEFLRLFEFTDR
jgi:hypothetical protein